MNTLETRELNKLRAALKARGHEDWKLHGGRYQTGLPDMLFVAPRHLGGLLYLLEAKAYRGDPKAVTSGASLISMLRGAPGAKAVPKRQAMVGGGSPQYAVFRALQVRNAAAFVACFLEATGRWCLYAAWEEPAVRPIFANGVGDLAIAIEDALRARKVALSPIGDKSP